MSEFDENRNENMQNELNNETDNQIPQEPAQPAEFNQPAQPEPPKPQIPEQQPKQQTGYGSSPTPPQGRYYGQGYNFGYGNNGVNQPNPQAPQNPQNQNFNSDNGYNKKTSYVYYGNNASQYNQQGYSQNQYYGNQPIQNPAYSAPANHTSKQGRKKGKLIFVICIASLFVLAIIFTALSASGLLFNSNGQSEKIDAPSIAITDTPALTQEDTPTDGSALSAKAVYQKVKDASVGVLVYSGNVKAGEGSGVIVGEDDAHKYSYILTCAHVVSDGGTIKVQLSDESQYDAYLIGYDSRTDIAVLRIAKTGLTAIEIGDSDKLVVGETVYAIGNPGGIDFAGSFTNGIVSAIARPISSEIGYEMVCIQHTAAINPGNSGGALVNEYGQLVGINSSKIASTDYEGMGFSVPSSTIVEVYNEIIAHGYVTNRPKLGIRYAPVSASQTYAMLAAANKLPNGSIIIASMDSDSSLVNTDAKVGDIITKLNGKELETSDDLPDYIEENCKVGDKLTLTVCHFDNSYQMTEFDIEVTLVEDKGTVEQVTEPVTESQQDYYYNPFGFYGFGNGN